MVDFTDVQLAWMRTPEGEQHLYPDIPPGRFFISPDMLGGGELVWSDDSGPLVRRIMVPSHEEICALLLARSLAQQEDS